MDIKYKLYPHPVLLSDTDDYVKSSFRFEANVEKGIRELIFTFHMSLDNSELLAMIQEEFVEFLVHIECPMTCYRTVVTSKDTCFSKRISETKLNGKVSLCAFLVAKKDLPAYTNADFNPDYGERTFAIDRGSIMAIAGQYDLTVVKDTEELTKLPSIFTICKCAGDTDRSMRIAIDGDKITINLSEHSFQKYQLLINMPQLLPVFHAMIIVPALIFTFETMRREGVEEYEYRRWYAAIRKTLEKYDIVLGNEVLNDFSSYDLAQKLLDLPVERALDALTMVGDDEEE